MSFSLKCPSTPSAPFLGTPYNPLVAYFGFIGGLNGQLSIGAGV